MTFYNFLIRRGSISQSVVRKDLREEQRKKQKLIRKFCNTFEHKIKGGEIKND